MSRRAICTLALLLAALALSAGCRRIEQASLDPVRALRSRVVPRFRPAADGVLTNAQIEMFLRAKRQAGSAPEAEAVRGMGIDFAEFVWTGARITEALGALDSRLVLDAAAESEARALTTLRAARAATHDSKAMARLDGEIASLEKERASLRKLDPVAPSLQRNAAIVAARRRDIESAGP